MAPGATLHSDHVNYLILRYLQEAGHEKAATAFYTDWQRTPEHRDPESLPFAPAVRRGELVNVIQDGLHHDELLARVKKNERKFRFTTGAHAAEAMEIEGAAVENGAQASRPSSSEVKRKGRPPAMRPPDEFPTPAPKRQRRSEGSEGVHLNGDAMDVDAASGSGDAEEDGEAASPAVASEVEIVEVPERYDSMDVAVQTNPKTGPKTTTMSWKVDRPGATIYHSIFNPDPSPENGNTLMTVGENLCRFYQVPEAPDDTKQITRIDQPSLPLNSVVTASAWHPKGHTSVCAIDSVRELPGGRQRAEQQILSHSRDAGTSASFLLPPLLQPAGIILALRYSADGEHLLVTRTNLKRGLVLIYDISPGARSQEPVAWRICEQQVLDAAWDGSDPRTFVICGEHDLAECWTLQDHSASSVENGLTEENIATVGLSKVPFPREESATPRKWDKVTHDGSGTYAIASVEDHHMSIIARAPAAQLGPNTAWLRREIDLPGQLNAFAFWPAPEPHQRWSSLGVAFDDGTCTLYNIRRDDDGVQYGLVNFHLGEGAALALAWSHDGRYLAVGGHELVQVWDVYSLIDVSDEGIDWDDDKTAVHEPLVTWRPEIAAASKAVNGEHEDDQPLSEPSLSWSADGERLAFAVDKQISVISFRPPLPRGPPPEEEEQEDGEATTNAHGHAE